MASTAPYRLNDIGRFQGSGPPFRKVSWSLDEHFVAGIGNNIVETWDFKTRQRVLLQKKTNKSR